MYKIIQDYFTAFRWQKIKQTYKNGNWWMFLYLLIVLPLIMQMHETKNSILAYMLIMIPFLFSMFAAPLHPMLLPKIMYLCPMSRDARKEYIIKSSLLRVSVSVIIGSLGVLSLLFLGISDGISAAGIWFNHLLFSICLGSGTNAGGYGKVNETGQRAMNMDTKQGVIESLSIITALLLCLSYILMFSWDTTPAWWVKWILIGISIFFELPLVFNYLKYWKQTANEVLCYENSYRN